LAWKEYGLPEGYVVIFEPGAECIYCLDTTQIYNGECPKVKKKLIIYEFIKQQLEIND